MPGKGEPFINGMTLRRVAASKPKALGMVNAKEAILKRHKASPRDCRLRLPPTVKIASKNARNLELSLNIW